MGGSVLRLLERRSVLLVVLLALVIVVMSLISPYFFSVTNLLGITQFGAVLVLLAIGQSLVITSGRGGIDLSIGSMLSLSGVAIGMLVQQGVNVWLASLLGIVSGGLFGALNGLMVAYIGLPPLITTLGTNYLYGSLALYLTNGVPISGFPESFEFLGQGLILGIPAQVLLVALPVFALFWFIVYRTRFGREIYLIGTNEIAARFSAIQVKQIRFSLYTISGLLAGLGSVIMCSWLMTARADVGSGMDMQSITVSVLGGVSITGGQGHLASVMLAVLVVTMLSSGMQIANINSMWQLAILGMILLFAVALNQFVLKRSASK
jgi:Ribose/xylose/arabinose/galactoside ABC-type transport systems, permease components